MEYVSSLAKELKAHLPWQQARIVFLAQFILALLRSRPCNFYRVAESFQSKAQTESSYRRIIALHCIRIVERRPVVEFEGR